MEYNTKYRLNYCNSEGTPLRIDLQIKGYVGQVFILANDKYLKTENDEFVTANIDGDYDENRDVNSIISDGNPFTLNYKNDLGEKAGTIRSTFADMSFYENDLFNIDDLATSDETGIRCKFYCDGEIEWVDYVTSDFFNVEITHNPIINLTASDRIGILKDISYNISDIYTDDTRSYAYILAKALKRTGLELNINVIADFNCEEFVSKSRPNHAFLDTYVSELRYLKSDETGETESCYDVIKGICNVFNCSITQYRGEWWVFNKRQVELGEGYVVKLNQNGAYQSDRRFEQKEVNFSLIDVGGERTLIPAGAKNTYLLDHSKNNLYPKNRTFKGSNLVTMSGWSFRPTPQTVLQNELPIEYNHDGSWEWTKWYEDSRNWLTVSDSRYYTISEDPPQNIPVNISDQGNYILESDKFDIPSMDGNKMSFDLSVKAIGKPYTAVRLMLILQFDDPVYKYAFLGLIDGEWRFNFQKFINDTDFTNIDTGDNFNVIGVTFENKYGNRNIAVEQDFKISVDAAAGASQQHLDLNNAKMFVRIYSNATAGTSINPKSVTNVIKEIKIDFKSDAETPKGTVYQNTIEGNFTKPTDERKVLTGDYQVFGQNGYFYRYREDSYSIQYNENKEMTENWTTILSDKTDPLLVHSVRQLADSYSRSHEELSIGFDLDRIDPLALYAVLCVTNRHLVVEDEKHVLDNQSRHIMAGLGKYINNKKYLFTEGQIDYFRMRFTGRLSQVIKGEAETKEFIYSFFEDKDIS